MIQHSRQLQAILADVGTSHDEAVPEDGCVWCGLPVGVPTSAKTSSAEKSAEALYCCYGCRVAHAVTQEKGVEGAVRWTIVRLGLAVFFTMNLMAFTMTMWSLDVYDVQPDPFQLKLFEVFRWLSMLFGLPVLLLLGIPLLHSAIECWRKRIYSTDLLVATGVIAAYAISVFNVLTAGSPVYFEVGAMVLVAVTLGRWLEAIGKQKATEALDQLSALLPTTATLVVDDESKSRSFESEISSTEIQAGHHIRVGAGERFPTDGIVVTGRTTVDEQVFTGESTPIERVTGDSVLAGTVNLDGDIVVRCTSGFRQGSFGKLLALMQEARTARGHYQRLADKVSMWFFPVISVVALATLVWHSQSGYGVAIQRGLSVLLIACPCALGLATPLAVWTSLSTAIRHQVLFRSGEAIERLAGVKSICLDKTGTLTTGRPSVLRMIDVVHSEASQLSCEDGDGDRSAIQSLRNCQWLASRSNHPFSRAISEYLSEANSHCTPNDEVCGDSDVVDAASVRSLPGLGIEAGSTKGQCLRLGSIDFATGMPGIESPAVKVTQGSLRDQIVAEADSIGSPLVVYSIDGNIELAFLMHESIRGETRPAMRMLRSLHLPVTVLTGDRDSRAQRLVSELNEDCGHKELAKHTSSDEIVDNVIQVVSQLSPEGKVQAVQQLRSRYGQIVMVGDGINDAPALAVADIGIAMGCGADVSRDSAQVCLLSNDLGRISWAIRLARQTRRVIRQNLFWAFGYNGVGVLLAAVGVLNPAVAAGLMIASSLLVITNSLRLMGFDASGENPDDSDSASACEIERPTANWQPRSNAHLDHAADADTFVQRTRSQPGLQCAESRGRSV